MKQAFIEFVKQILFSLPKRYKKNHINFSESQIEELKDSIDKNYLDRGYTKERLSKEEYEQALLGQLFYRLDYNRTRIIPWLDSVKPLKGSSILEVGCGTGISTLALSEQGAVVTGVDIDEGALKVNEDRLRIANIPSDTHIKNGDKIIELNTKSYDFIIYYAALEHMTVEERISSINQAWSMLKSGSYLVIIETPNRLWYHDSHTAGLPFFDWLPDDLAFYYSKYSNRANFKDLFREINEDKMMSFKRWGRGMSYHELEIATELPLSKLNLVSSLGEFEKSAFLKNGILGSRYVKFLKTINKDLKNGFCYPYLDVVIRKP